MSVHAGPRRVVPTSQHGGGVQVLTQDTIGLPIVYPDGPYKGKMILALIKEVQKPDLGRKYAKRDSRPLDPPPIVQIKLFEVLHYGTPGERRVELDDSDVFMPGLICYAELFPYNADFEYDPRIYPDGRPEPTPIQPENTYDAGRPLARANTYPPDNLPRQPRIPLTRDAALSLQLHGECHQNVILVPDIRGSAKKVLYFVFPELHVLMTGHFMLKYTAMHVEPSVLLPGKAPLLAECWGGVFAVYSGKQHPSLRPSTELTNHVSRNGAKLHLRHKQRVGRGHAERLDGGTTSPPTPTPTLPSVKRPLSKDQTKAGKKRRQKQQSDRSVENSSGSRKRADTEMDSDVEDEERRVGHGSMYPRSSPLADAAAYGPQAQHDQEQQGGATMELLGADSDLDAEGEPDLGDWQPSKP